MRARTLSQAAPQLAPDRCDDFTPVVLNGWDTATVEAVLDIGFVFIIDVESGQAIAVPMETACDSLRVSGLAAYVDRLRSTDRPFIRVDRRTPDRIVMGTLLGPRPMSRGGQC